jgi:hypothetical protein
MSMAIQSEPERGRESRSCIEGRVFTRAEREAIAERFMGPKREVPWIIQGDVTVVE